MVQNVHSVNANPTTDEGNKDVYPPHGPNEIEKRLSSVI